MLRLGSLLLLLWVTAVNAQTLIPLGGSGGGSPSSIPAGTPVTGCATANGVFYNSSNTFACASGFTTDGVTATLTGGTQTASNPVLNLSQTWNNVATTFTGLKFNATNTASGGSSMLLDLQNNGVSQFSVRYDGSVNINNSVTIGGVTIPIALSVGGGVNGVTLGSPYTFGITPTSNAFQPPDTILSRKAAATWQIGAADVAAPVAQTIGPQSVVAGTSNTNGANFTIRGSAGTGTGAGGSIVFQTAPAGSSGSTQNPYIAALTINSAQQATFAATVRTGGYTVGALPGGVVGMRAYVTDQLTACVATGAALVGGGAVTCPAFYNGAAWVGG